MKWSYSQFKSFACPRRYYLERVEKIPVPRAANLVCGSTLHEGLAAIFKGEDPIKAFRQACLREKLDQAQWKGSSRWAARQNQATWEAYAPGVLASYRAHYGPRLDKPKIWREHPYVERKEEIDLPDGDKLVVIMDLVTEDGIIIDHKGVGRLPDRDSHERYRLDLQLKLYAWAYHKKFGELPRGTQYDFVVLTKLPQFDRSPVYPITMADIEMAHEDIEQIVRTIYWHHETGIWPRNRSCCLDFNELCPFYAHCFGVPKPQEDALAPLFPEDEVSPAIAQTSGGPHGTAG